MIWTRDSTGPLTFLYCILSFGQRVNPFSDVSVLYNEDSSDPSDTPFDIISKIVTGVFFYDARGGGKVRHSRHKGRTREGPVLFE